MNIAKKNKKSYLILDRFEISGRSYAKAQGLSGDMLFALETICALYPKPDFAFIIDTPVDTAFKRIEGREVKDSFESSISVQSYVHNDMIQEAREKGYYILNGLQKPEFLVEQVLRVII